MKNKEYQRRKVMLIHRAIEFAKVAHTGQLRKFTDEPYIIHPLRVAHRLCEHTADTEIISAAILHDVVEDTPVTLIDIEKDFGARIAKLVDEVTDRSKPEDGVRAIRKKIDRDHTAKASPAGQSIKPCDRLDNLSDILDHAPGFANVYLEETRLLLEVLTEGHPALYKELEEMVTHHEIALSRVG
jgi:(p)ppGpp synthase/HD superfamily hydrolase